MAANSRKGPRDPAQYRIAVKRGESYASVLPADVSDEGLGLVLPFAVVVGDTLDLVVTTGKKVYEVLARVRWVTAEPGGKTRVGVQLSPDDLERGVEIHKALRG